MVVERGKEAFEATEPTEDGDWSAFLEANSSSEFLNGWLALAGRQISGARSAVLFLRGAGGTLGIAATWEVDEGDNGEGLEPFHGAARIGNDRRTPTVHVEANSDTFIAYPLLMDRQVQAVLVVRFEKHPGGGLAAVLRQLHWSTGWIEAQLWRGRAALSERPVRTADTVLQLLASADQHARFDGAALALVNALPELTGFDRAALGMQRGFRRRVRLEALSRSSSFKRRADHVAEFEAAMTEACDQSVTIALPDPREGHMTVDASNRALRERVSAGALVTFPLMVRGAPVGAVTCLRGRADDEVVRIEPETISGLELAAAAVAPILKLKHDERRWISGRLRDLAGRALTAVLGRRPALSLLAIVLLLALVLPAVLTAPLRVRADATLEGGVQRSAVALTDGYLADSGVRAGDLVKAGQELARLDDRELLLQQTETQAQLTRALQESRDALATGDRSGAARSRSDVAEAEAALALVSARLDRLVIRSPIDGIVISGDLRQRLGAPVQRGEVLFEVAQLSDYRVRIDVSEYDLALVSEGQAGNLVLNGLPGEPVGFTVTGIASVSDPREGENRFRAEADVLSVPEGVRPGMEGIAKIETGRASLWHIVTRGTVARLRVLLWQIWP